MTIKKMKYVAFFDILGFSDLVEKNDHNELEKIYEAFNSAIQQSHIKIFRPMPGNENVIIPDFSETLTNSICISDSVLVWTNDDSFKSFYALVEVCNRLLWSSFIQGLPLRGSMTVGELSPFFDNKESATQIIRASFVGLSVVDAYQLANSQNWSGAILTKSCFEHKDDILKMELEKNETQIQVVNGVCFDKIKVNNHILKGELVQYAAPFKKGTMNEEYVFNWTKLINRNLNEQEIRSYFEKHKKNSKKWEVESIIQNTIKFISYTKKSSS